jgi:hypothetical protein
MAITMSNYVAQMRIKSGSALSAGLLLFAVLIASAAMPDVPGWLTTLFNNTIFKLAYLTLILIMFNYCPLTALLIALIFIIILQSLNKYSVNRSLEPSHNIKETAKSIIQSIADTSSELVSDSGEIIKTVGKSISHTRDYIINEDSFENLKPTKTIPSDGNYSALGDLYIGKKHPQDFSDTVSPKNSYYDKNVPSPEEQCIGQPTGCGTKEQFTLDTNYAAMPGTNYTAIPDKYVGPPHAPDFSDITPPKNSYYNKNVPSPEDQCVGQPVPCRTEQFTQEVNYSKVEDLYTGVPFVEQYPKYEGKYTGYLVSTVPQPLDQESVYP